MLLPFNIGTASGCHTPERLAANAIMSSNAAAGPNSAATCRGTGGISTKRRNGEVRVVRPFFRLHRRLCLPVGVEGGLVAYPTDSAQNQIQTSKSRSIEPYR